LGGARRVEAAEGDGARENLLEGRGREG